MMDYLEETIDYIRRNEPPEGYFVGFSGGKDSVVVLDLVRRAGVRHQAWYSYTTIDPPEVVRFIKKNYQVVKWAYPAMSFFRFIYEYPKGYPTISRRWCCDLLKKAPVKNNPLCHRIMGTRAEESARRAARPRTFSNGRITYYKPIFSWLEWQIWDHIEKYDLPYCELYDQGFDRLGCVICPFITGR